MKPTIKVSIGSYAFNLEENAYHIIDDYLKSLKRYFANNQEGDEIISDVESRMAELLQMRMPKQETAISENDAKEVVSIMGNPRDFGGGNIGESEFENTNNSFDFSRKLYRDPDNGIIAGVCSGLAYYFRTDPVVLRVIFVVLLLVLNFGTHKLNMLVVVVYLVLWGVMPKAVTFVQKLAMKGTDPSIANIEDRDRIELPVRKSSNILLKIIKIFIGFILGVIAFAFLISIIAILAALSGVYQIHTHLLSPALVCMEALGIFSLDQRIAMIMVVCLPLIGILYLCAKLLFWRRFVMRDLAISCIAFIFWIGSVFYIGGLVVNIVQQHKYNNLVTQNIPIQTASDVLYVRLPDNLIDSESFYGTSFLSYIDKGNEDYSVFFMPEIRIKYDSNLTNYKVELEKKAFASTKSQARKRANEITLNYTINDSLMVVNPELYDKNHVWDRKLFRLVITAPETKKVVVEEPLVDFRYYDSNFY